MTLPTTFLRVFVEIIDTNTSLNGIKCSTPDIQPSRHRTRSAFANTSRYASPSTLKSSKNNRISQYTTVPITCTTTASEVCMNVAKKRNVEYNESNPEYELVMCDGDGHESFDRLLSPNDIPWQFQQSAAKHGHLGDFHFKFRTVSEESDTDSDDSEKFFFPGNQCPIKHVCKDS